MRSRRHRLAAALAAVGLVGTAAFAGAGSALAVPAAGVATVRLAGVVSPPAPDANSAQAVPITIPLTVTNTGRTPLYDLAVGSLRSAPITTRSQLTTAFGGAAVEESGATTRGPTQPAAGPLAPGASERVDYAVDSSNDGICLCFLGVYALDLLVTAADEPGGETATVARTQTYLPSLLGVTSPMRVGWLWPLLDRPHRLGTGNEFADDDLAASVSAGGRLDRALSVVESVDAADAAHPGLARSVLLLLDPEILDELATMAGGYTVEAANGTVSDGTGRTAAQDWLGRLAAVLPEHDVRMTAPADPDVVGLAAAGVDVRSTPDATVTARITQALGLAGGTLPPHDLAWPVESDLDAGAVAALAATGATRVVTAADTADGGAVAALSTSSSAATTTPALLADPDLTAQAGAAIGLGKDNSNALQRLVASAAMTGVQHKDDSRFVFVAPNRLVDVAPAAAVRAIEATSSLGSPTSPVAALAEATTGAARTEPLATQPTTAPAPLGVALTAAAGATRAASSIRAMVASGADAVIGDLPTLAQLSASNDWVGDAAAAGRWTAAVNGRVGELRNAVTVVVPATGGYSLASADAPLLLTVSNSLPLGVNIEVDVTAVGRSNGFTARITKTSVAAGSRPTIKVPTSVTRSGRFEVAVTLRTEGGAPIGPPARLTVTSTAVGAVGQIVTYGAAALLVLALVVRGVRRLIVRSRAGSGGTGPDDDTMRPDGRPEGQPTVPATPS